MDLYGLDSVLRHWRLNEISFVKISGMSVSGCICMAILAMWHGMIVLFFKNNISLSLSLCYSLNLFVTVSLSLSLSLSLSIFIILFPLLSLSFKYNVNTSAHVGVFLKGTSK